MGNGHLTLRVELPVSAEEAWAWHLRPGALERLSPPWEETRVLADDGVKEGGRTVLEVAIGPVHERWVAVHRDVQPGRGFTDEQVEGPFKRFVHQHRFEAIDAGRCALVDDVEYQLPLGALGRLVGGGLVERRLARMFTYRHAVLLDDLRRGRELPGPRLTVAMSGQSGLLGRALTSFLTTQGHAVRRLVRRTPVGDEIAWDPERGALERDKLRGVDAVVHLAGENLGDGRWTEAKKARIKDSRVRGTGLLAEALAALGAAGPRVLVSASASGWYGDRAEPVDEDSPPGEGFLAEVCAAWEAAAEPARQAGLRVVHPRLGVVLHAAEGALPKLVSAFNAGVGGKVGPGTQGMSWIAIDDAVAALDVAVRNPALTGPVNLCAPELVDNSTFSAILGRALHRPSVVPLPRGAVKLALGEMGEALLLQGQRVKPARLQAIGHRFAYPTLDGALRHLLGLPAA